MIEIKKPKSRSRLRQFVGKEYYILKRKKLWYFGSVKWAESKNANYVGFRVFQHKSMILRPLKDVEMYLQENKRINLQIAISHLNNVVIEPGERFSIWKLIGRPSRKKGYLEGLVLKQGQISKDIGGGLCQLGNLLFWIFAHSPLTIVERYRHGFDVFPDVNRKVPFGAGATLSYNHIDFQVENTTDKSFQIKLWLDEIYLRGELFCEQKLQEKFTVEERNHQMKQQIWGGYSRHNQIYQVQMKNGVLSERLLVENHAVMMYNPFLK
jgi:vancomycin resistance protein VanW